MSKDIVILGTNNIETLVAITEEEQSRGLMYKKFPPPVMAFPFKKAHISKFWMRNTPSPLDIVFCNDRKIIAIYSGDPYSLDLIGPDTLTDLVVELPRGTAKKLGIKAGDFADIKYSINSLARKYASYNIS